MLDNKIKEINAAIGHGESLIKHLIQQIIDNQKEINELQEVLGVLEAHEDEEEDA